jgi:hypothetical protein
VSFDEPPSDQPSSGEPSFDAPRSGDSPPSTRRRGRRVRRIRRGPILLVVVVALVAAVVAQQNASSPSGASPAAAAARAGIGIPPTDVASSTWYCAAGTSSPDGDAPETLLIASLAPTDVDVSVTVMPGGDNPAPATDRMRLAPGEQVNVRVADVLATAEPGVAVETVGGPTAVSHALEHDGDVAVESCTRSVAPDWYFSSGTTVEGSTQNLLLFNPFGDDAIVDISFVTDAGVEEPASLQALVVPRRSRITVPVQDSVLRQAHVATHVHARAGRVVAEETQTFADVVVDGSTRRGITLSAGATAPTSNSWIPAGSTRDGGRAQLALANFSVDDARVDVTTIVAGGDKIPPQTARVAAQGVTVVDVTTRVPLGQDITVVATSRAVDGRRIPVVAQLLTSWAPASSITGIGSTLGSTVAATRWVVPVPDIDGDATVTVFNPGSEPVTAALLPADLVDRKVGATSEPELAIPAGAAKTVRLALLGSRSSAGVVTADHPVVVGLTVLGNAGAALSTAIPDLTHTDTDATRGG